MSSTCWRCKGDLVDIGHGLQCMNNCPPAPLSSKNQLTVAELLAELEKWDDSPDGPAWVARAAILEIERLRAWLDQQRTADIAAAVAHRACCGSEHDPSQGRLHGYCLVCGVPWPCDTAKHFLRPAIETNEVQR